MKRARGAPSPAAASTRSSQRARRAAPPPSSALSAAAAATAGASAQRGQAAAGGAAASDQVAAECAAARSLVEQLARKIKDQAGNYEIIPYVNALLDDAEEIAPADATVDMARRLVDTVADLMRYFSSPDGPIKGRHPLSAPIWIRLGSRKEIVLTMEDGTPKTIPPYEVGYCSVEVFHALLKTLAKAKDEQTRRAAWDAILAFSHFATGEKGYNARVGTDATGTTYEIVSPPS